MEMTTTKPKDTIDIIDGATASIEPFAKSEDDIIRQVAEEEGMTYEEVKEMWEMFKEEAIKVNARRRATKPKRDKSKDKSKKKQAKKSKRKNR